jgi:hypothetical protein
MNTQEQYEKARLFQRAVDDPDSHPSSSIILGEWLLVKGEIT